MTLSRPSRFRSEVGGACFVLVMKHVLAVMLLPVLCASANAGDSGEFHGVYVEEGSVVPATQADRDMLQLKCLLAPDIMHEDGRGAGYYLDRALFLSTGKVSFVKAQTFNCRYDSSKRMETCESQEHSDKGATTYYRTNVYETFTRDVQRGATLFTPEDVAAWTSTGAVNPAGKFAFHRCTCVTVEQIEALAQPLANTLPHEQTGPIRYWWGKDPNAEAYDIARRVEAAFGGCRPHLS
jgi:hypothetical protein